MCKDISGLRYAYRMADDLILYDHSFYESVLQFDQTQIVAFILASIC